MAIIKNFKSSNVWRAFILNSIAATLIIYISIEMQHHYRVFKDDKGNKINSEATPVDDTIISLCLTFLTSLFAYILLYIVFGFGGGMLVAGSKMPS